MLCRHGCVACTQPLASEIGLRVLRRGGNAADAAVAVAAALNVTEPCSTGIGGDCFCLFYEASSKTVKGINGRYAYHIVQARLIFRKLLGFLFSGRCSSHLTLDLLKEKGYTPTNPIPAKHALNVTVPGAAAGWVDTIEKFGSGKVSRTETNEMHPKSFPLIIC